MQAQAIVEEHCAGLTKDQTTARASALGAIGPVYDRVSRAYEETGIGWLLYWRGVLGQCLDQDTAAEVDLYAFVAQKKDDTSVSELVKDAQRRLRILKRRSGGGDTRSTGAAVGIVVGCGFAGGAVFTGIGLAVETAAKQQTHQDLINEGGASPQPRDSLIVRGDEQARRQSVLVGLTVGLGVGSALSFVLSALPPPGGGGTALRLTSGPGALGLGVDGRW